MTTDPLVLMAEVDRATERLLGTAERFTDADIREASRLPGWTRGHVLTHVARNANSLINLLTWARTGVVTPQYPSRQQRDADIEAGAGRPAAECLADLRAAAARFAEASAQMPAEAWAVVLETQPPQPAARIVWRRLREVEIHHVDLAAGYQTSDWPAAFSHRLLHDFVAALTQRPDAPALMLHSIDAGHVFSVGDTTDAPTVSGPAHALAAWLAGRAAGAGLTLVPEGPLPKLPQLI